MQGNSANTVEFTLDSIAPEIVDPKNYEELKSPQGLIVTLDTTSIQQNYLLEEEDDEELQDEQQQILGEEEKQQVIKKGDTATKDKLTTSNQEVTPVEPGQNPE